MAERYIPNSFQTPNFVVDSMLPHLDLSEIRVMMFATRHILGWQDHIGNRIATMSLEMIENGYCTSDGIQYEGTGLCRTSIIKALDYLVKINYLERLGTTPDGQTWTLHMDNVDLERLKQRSLSRTTANKKRMVKVRRGLLDRPLEVYPIDPQGVYPIDTNKPTIQTHIQTQEIANAICDVPLSPIGESQTATKTIAMQTENTKPAPKKKRATKAAKTTAVPVHQDMPNPHLEDKKVSDSGDVFNTAEFRQKMTAALCFYFDQRPTTSDGWALMQKRGKFFLGRVTDKKAGLWYQEQFTDRPVLPAELVAFRLRRGVYCPTKLETIKERFTSWRMSSTYAVDLQAGEAQLAVLTGLKQSDTQVHTLQAFMDVWYQHQHQTAAHAVQPPTLEFQDKIKAISLATPHITPQAFSEYLSELKSEPFWSCKPLSLDYVVRNIGTWDSQRTHLPDITTRRDFSQLSAEEQERELLLQKAAEEDRKWESGETTVDPVLQAQILTEMAAFSGSIDHVIKYS